MAPLRIVALEGDQTGQELLEQALRVLTPEVLGIDLEVVRHDLSLANRRATENAVCTEAAAAIRATGLGLKAATITPEGQDDAQSSLHTSSFRPRGPRAPGGGEGAGAGHTPGMALRRAQRPEMLASSLENPVGRDPSK